MVFYKVYLFLEFHFFYIADILPICPRRPHMGPTSHLTPGLTLRNTPDPDCKLSPAQILFGHPLRDAMPRINERTQKFDNLQFSPIWRDAWTIKEEALRTRYARTLETLKEHSRSLPPLRHGDKVFIQNQEGNHPKKWDRSGTVVECRTNDQYIVKVDGTGRLTLRNRRFLRRFEPHSLSVYIPAVAPTATSLPHPSHRSQEADTVMSTPPTSEMPTPPVTQDNVTHEVPYPPEAHLPAAPSVQPPPSPTMLEPTASPSLPTAPLPTTLPRSSAASERQEPRRSSRDRKPKLVYDPESGSYVEPSQKGH